jgi:hypothetical protein
MVKPTLYRRLKVYLKPLVLWDLQENTIRQVLRTAVKYKFATLHNIKYSKRRNCCGEILQQYIIKQNVLMHMLKVV